MTNEEFVASITLDGEEWKEIPNYEGYYCASNFGRILSMGRFVAVKNGGIAWHTPRLLSFINKRGSHGYYTVSLSKDGVITTHTVHRLVASTFIPNPLGSPQIDHIDGNKTNNNANNLRWCTNSENMSNPVTLKVMSKVQSGIVKPSLHKQVLSIKNGRPLKVYETLRSVFNDGYSPSMVHRVCNGVSSDYKGLQWAYLTDYLSLVNQ